MNDYKVIIEWSAEDVQSLRPNLTTEQAGVLLDQIGKALHERSVEEGWDVMRDLLSIYDYENATEDCEHETVDCPEHEGAYDCTPFCQVCEGNQTYCPTCTD